MTPEAFGAALAALRQVSGGLDGPQFRDSLHVPQDAGEYADALRRMLARIPDGWGRWIRCDRGWYPLLVELDAELNKLVPRYELHQAKEKFGTLRFYWGAGERILDPGDPEPAAPEKDASDTAWEAWHAELEAWGERLERYLESEEGRARAEDLRRRVELAEQLVEAIGVRSAVTCELCGKRGEQHCTRAALRWHKTLCAACVHASDYIAVGQP